MHEDKNSGGKPVATSTMPPRQDPEDLRRALDRAMEARRRRADVRGRIAAGELSASSVVMSDDPALKRMRVHDLLTALPFVGSTKAEATMRSFNIAMSRRLGGLGFRQRRELCSWLDYYQEQRGRVGSEDC